MLLSLLSGAVFFFYRAYQDGTFSTCHRNTREDRVPLELILRLVPPDSTMQVYFE